jgi:hypothetical protein
MQVSKNKGNSNHRNDFSQTSYLLFGGGVEEKNNALAGSGGRDPIRVRQGRIFEVRQYDVEEGAVRAEQVLGIVPDKIASLGLGGKVEDEVLHGPTPLPYFIFTGNRFTELVGQVVYIAQVISQESAYFRAVHLHEKLGQLGSEPLKGFPFLCDANNI